MSVRAAPLNTAAADLGSAIAEVQPEAAALAEGNSFATQSPEHPLHREVVVSIKASLNDLCLQKSKGTWAPTPEALKSIFQQRKFTSLEGSSEPHGDLKVSTSAIQIRLQVSQCLTRHTLPRHSVDCVAQDARHSCEVVVPACGWHDGDGCR